MYFNRPSKASYIKVRPNNRYRTKILSLLSHKIYLRKPVPSEDRSVCTRVSWGLALDYFKFTISDEGVLTRTYVFREVRIEHNLDAKDNRAVAPTKSS